MNGPNDSLSSYKSPETGGLFLKLRSDEPVTLRVLTLDPLVSKDKWGNTKYSFTVWNWNEGKAQILQKPKTVLKMLTAIHQDDDFPALNKVDVKITATGELKETRYSIMALPKTRELTKEMVDQARTINLETLMPEGIRLSAVIEGQEVPQAAFSADSSMNDQKDPITAQPGYMKAKQEAERIKNKNNVDKVFLSDEPPEDFLV